MDLVYLGCATRVTKQVFLKDVEYKNPVIARRFHTNFSTGVFINPYIPPTKIIVDLAGAGHPAKSSQLRKR